MISKKHRLIMYGVAVQLLAIAIVCYAAFPVKAPEEPIRRVYYTTAGSVLFDHRAHTSIKGYGLVCADCHHPHGDQEIETVSCGLCHPPRQEGSQHPEFCMDCHSDVSEFENQDTMKRADAFHAQCIGCHEQFGKGPRSGPQECSKCHVL